MQQISLAETTTAPLSTIGSPAQHSVAPFMVFEALRAYMAWWVVIGHAIHLLGLEVEMPRFFRLLLTSGDIAVNVFIILSGFVITHLLLVRKETYGSFVVRRAFRIFPIYFVCLLIALLTHTAYEFAYSQDWVFGRDMKADRLVQVGEYMWTHVLLHLTMLHGAIPDSLLKYSSSSLLSPAWSLSLEWQFYLVAPLIVGLAAKGIRSFFFIALALVGAGMCFRSGMLGTWIYPSMLLLSIPFFLIGIASRLIVDRLTNQSLKTLLAGAALVVLIGHGARSELFIWCFFLVLAVFERKTARGESSPLLRRIAGIAANSVARDLGRASYSTYLIHIPLFAVSSLAVGRAVETYSRMDAGLAIVFSMVILVPVSKMLYRYVESPFISLGARISRRYAK